MDPVRFGNDVRLLRSHRRWSQRRLAGEAKVSRCAVATIEGGRAGGVALDHLIRVVAALGAYLSVRIVYQGEGLDRLRDQRHAGLADAVVAHLRVAGWDVATEVSLNHFGERGSIDILAYHSAARTLLVIEVKSVVPDVGGMLATLDRKVRLAPGIALERGWQADRVARLLVLPETSTARRRIDDHEATFRNGLPARNVDVKRWFRAPNGALSGLLFLSTARGGSQRRPSKVGRTSRGGRFARRNAEISSAARTAGRLTRQWSSAARMAGR